MLCQCLKIVLDMPRPPRLVAVAASTSLHNAAAPEDSAQDRVKVEHGPVVVQKT